MMWFKRNWRYVLTCLGCLIIGGLISLLFILMRDKEGLKILENAKALVKAKSKVKGLELEQQTRQAELQVNEAARLKLEQRIIDEKKKAVATEIAVDNMSAEEIANEYRKLGF